MIVSTMTPLKDQNTVVLTSGSKETNKNIKTIYNKITYILTVKRKQLKIKQNMHACSTKNISKNYMYISLILKCIYCTTYKNKYWYNFTTKIQITTTLQYQNLAILTICSITLCKSERVRLKATNYEPNNYFKLSTMDQIITSSYPQTMDQMITSSYPQTMDQITTSSYPQWTK